ncbi:MAG: hypothetical protein AAF416_11530 [Pseudomonadota bacterium]
MIDPRRGDPWPAETTVGERAYLQALVEQGPAALCANAEGTVAEILRVGDRAIPVLLPDPVRSKAAFLVPTRHHLHYAVWSFARGSAVRRALLWIGVSPLIAAFWATGLDRVVFVNHWLLTASPRLELDAEGWAALFAFLAARYPGRAIVLPDVLPAYRPEIEQALKAAGGKSVLSRTVYVMDTSTAGCDSAGSSARRQWRKARALMERCERWRLDATAAWPSADHLRALYRKIYVDRYSPLNPDYRPAFFAVLRQVPETEHTAWVDDEGATEAFAISWWSSNGVVWSAMGYEPISARERRLFPLISARIFLSAVDQRAFLQWGGGSGDFKRFRGAVSTPQVDFIFDAHLPFRRRAGWQLLRHLRHLRARSAQHVDRNSASAGNA